MAVISIKSAGWLHGPGRTVWLGGAIRNFMAWVADGLANTFTVDNLTKITRLTRTDWQGTVALSAAARTNICKRSQDFSALWDHTDTPTPAFAVAPDGTTTATQITDGNAGVLLTTRQTTALVITPNGQYTASTYFKKSTGALTSYPGMAVLLTGVDTRVAYTILNTTTGAAAFDASSNIATKSLAVIDAGDYWRLQITFTDNQSNTGCKTVLYGAISANGTSISPSATGSAVVWGVQVETGPVATAYIPTTTAPVTVTDYALASEEVTLGETPVAGAVFTLDGDITADVEGA